MESHKRRSFWHPSEHTAKGWTQHNLVGTAKEALQYCLAQKWPWFVLEHVRDDEEYPHAVFLSTGVLGDKSKDVTVDCEYCTQYWGHGSTACLEEDSAWSAGPFEGYRERDLSLCDVDGVLNQLTKLNIPNPEPALQYYEFTCTEEEYDPKRVIREAVENGRLWVFIPDVDRGAYSPHVVIVRNDFAVPKLDAIREPFTEEWNSCCGDLNFKVPRGYRCYWIHRRNEQKVLDILSEPPPAPKKTHRIYYYGGK